MAREFNSLNKLGPLSLGDKLNVDYVHDCSMKLQNDEEIVRILSFSATVGGALLKPEFQTLYSKIHTVRPACS